MKKSARVVGTALRFAPARSIKWRRINRILCIQKNVLSAGPASPSARPNPSNSPTIDFSIESPFFIRRWLAFFLDRTPKKAGFVFGPPLLFGVNRVLAFS
jgi:hypothetical protein